MLNLATQVSPYCTWVSALLSKCLIRNQGRHYVKVYILRELGLAFGILFCDITADLLCNLTGYLNGLKDLTWACRSLPCPELDYTCLVSKPARLVQFCWYYIKIYFLLQKLHYLPLGYLYNDQSCFVIHAGSIPQASFIGVACSEAYSMPWSRLPVKPNYNVGF